MATAIEEITLAFDIAIATDTASGGFVKDAIRNALDGTALSFLTKLEGLASKRTVLFDTEPESLAPNHVVLAPIIQALEHLYVGEGDNARPEPNGRTYVLYAPSSQGKTAGAGDFLEGYLPLLLGENEQDIPPAWGIMITGTPGTNYFKFMSQRLGAGSCTSWVFSLIAALCPDPQNPERQPSLLVLDGLDHWNEHNELFVQKLYQASVDKGFYLVILAQLKKWASHMCQLNNGSKILALPRAMSGGTPREPEWNNLVWGKKLLSEMIILRYPNESQAWTDNDGIIHWIEVDDWTPRACLWHAQTLVRTAPSPTRARS